MSYLQTKNKYIEVNGNSIAYRELSKGKSEIPLVMLVHLAANMDNWDPLLVDYLSEHQHLILLDLPGVGASEGKVEKTLKDTAKNTISIIEELGYSKINLLGLSMGGMIAQEVVRHTPELIGKLILVGTGPRAGIGIDKVTSATFLHMLHAIIKRKDMKRYIFYTNDKIGDIESEKVFTRLKNRTKEFVDKPVRINAFLRQLKAIKKWGTAEKDDLKFIKQPTLIVNGEQDDMVSTENSYIMHKKITNSKLIIYPKSGHGSLFQNPKDFSEKVKNFLIVS